MIAGRLDLTVLVERVRRDRDAGEDLNVRRLARASGSAWRIALEEGATPWQADAWAIRCGFHPLEVWGAAWTGLIDEDDDAAGEQLTLLELAHTGAAA